MKTHFADDEILLDSVQAEYGNKDTRKLGKLRDSFETEVLLTHLVLASLNTNNIQLWYIYYWKAQNSRNCSDLVFSKSTIEVDDED